MRREIRFYRVNDPYGCFSNFSAHSICIQGQRWSTVEHYFQAQKFAGTEHEAAIREAKSPMIAARMGRSRQRPLRQDWEEVKDRIMYDALYAKFTQHKDLTQVLLSTEDAILIEHTANDYYWGDGGDGTGKNRLGQLLMDVRKELLHRRKRLNCE